MSTSYCSQVCELARRYRSLLGSHMSLWSTVGRREARLIMAGLAQLSGYQLANGWSLRTAGFTSSCLLHSRASASLQLASPGTFSGWPGHVLTAVSEKGERKWKHASIFFSSFITSGPLAKASHTPCRVRVGGDSRVSGLRVWITGRPVVGETIGAPPPLPPSALISPLSVLPLSSLSSAVLLPLH